MTLDPPLPLNHSVTFTCNNLIPYRAKLCRAKFSSGETIRRAKFSSLNEKFVTFARRKVSPNKSKSVLKWSTSEPTSDLSHLDKLWLHWWAKLCRAKFSSGEIIRRAKFSSLNEKFVTFARRKVSPPKIKVSLVEVRMNLRWKKSLRQILII